MSIIIVCETCGSLSFKVFSTFLLLSFPVIVLFEFDLYRRGRMGNEVEIIAAMSKPGRRRIVADYSDGNGYGYGTAVTGPSRFIDLFPFLNHQFLNVFVFSGTSIRKFSFIVVMWNILIKENLSGPFVFLCCS